ncbi:G-protein coupled receptor Mth2, partial [Stegodyphus mimosarum]
MSATEYLLKKGKFHICRAVWETFQREILQSCPKWDYEPQEYTILPNGSIQLFDEILENGTYEFVNGRLFTCVLDYDTSDDNVSISNHFPIEPMENEGPSVYIGKIGSAISIVALLIHLLTFCIVPALRNLPGYNLCSLSIAFLFGYSFLLIGQIHEVLGAACIASAVLQQYFFLAAFFCMNVMAFDIWRIMRMATQKLLVSSRIVKKRQFLWYSLYAWGAPLIIVVISVVLDFSKNTPDAIKPYYGRGDTCWMTNSFAKTIFFSVPSFSLITVNGIFFVLSAAMIKKNTMKNPNDRQVYKERINFILYVRLGLMIGITWMTGVIAAISKSYVVWIIFDVLNSLQGLFLFMLFTCSKKVYKHFRKMTSDKSTLTSSSDKLTTSSSSAASKFESTSFAHRNT